MKVEVKKNIVLWAILIALICANMLFAENGFQNAYLLITVFSVVKFLAIMFQFVEVKHAHFVWKMLSVGFALVYLMGVLILY